LEYFFRFECWWFLGITIPLVVISMILRHWFAPTIYFHYALAQTLKEKKYATTHLYQKLFYGIRLLVLSILALLVAKPQLVDKRSNIIVEGIDIMLVLDASGSMQFQDYSDDQRSRFEVAKEEAIRFIEKRANDAIGLVIFGKDAISRCPLTMDKAIITQMVNALNIGDIDPDGTMLARAIVTAINRLRQSKASSKIMIVLTDGEPSAGDMDPTAVTEIAKKFGIKIYTIGIGGEKDELFLHPLYGMVAKPKVNIPLLQQIARDTQGRFFMAHNARDMRSIYDTIDQLEKTKHESPVYSRYFDIFVPFVLACIFLLGLQQLLATFIWFSL
jgi:Ca-activated chloride channel family protein